jgi:hypothetical protein
MDTYKYANDKHNSQTQHMSHTHTFKKIHIHTHTHDSQQRLSASCFQALALDVISLRALHSQYSAWHLCEERTVTTWVEAEEERVKTYDGSSSDYKSSKTPVRVCNLIFHLAE